MKMKRSTRRMTISGARLAKFAVDRMPRHGEDRKATSEEARAVLTMMHERFALPILRGEASIRDLVTPAGGWASFDARNPDFVTLPVEEQLRTIFLR